MDDRPEPSRRGSPRYPTRYPVDGASLDPPAEFRGILCDLSVNGCQLHLDRRIPPGTAIEARCNIEGLGLRIRGEVVWGEAVTGGFLHGVVITGPASEEDALFHRLYIERRARRRHEGAG